MTGFSRFGALLHSFSRNVKATLNDVVTRDGKLMYGPLP